MKALFTVMIYVLAVMFLCFPEDVSAAPKVLCLEKDDQSLKIRGKKGCTKKGGTIVDRSHFENDSDILCYANVDGDSTPVAIKSFGGAKTTSVTVSLGIIIGFYTIECIGDFTGLASFDDLTVVATPTNSSFLALSNAGASISSPEISDTSIKFNVSTWNDTATGAVLANADFSLLVLGDL